MRQSISAGGPGQDSSSLTCRNLCSRSITAWREWRSTPPASCPGLASSRLAVEAMSSLATPPASCPGLASSRLAAEAMLDGRRTIPGMKPEGSTATPAVTEREQRFLQVRDEESCLGPQPRCFVASAVQKKQSADTLELAVASIARRM